MSKERREKKTEAITIKVTPSLKEIVDKVCRVEHRSTQSLIEMALVKHFKQLGYIKPTEDDIIASNNNAAAG